MTTRDDDRPEMKRMLYRGTGRYVRLDEVKAVAAEWGIPYSAALVIAALGGPRSPMLEPIDRHQSRDLSMLPVPYRVTGRQLGAALRIVRRRELRTGTRWPLERDGRVKE